LRLERFPITLNREVLWFYRFGRIFFGKPAATFPENALMPIKNRLHVTKVHAAMNRTSKRRVAQMRTKTAVRKTKAKPAAKRAQSKTSRKKVHAYRQRMRAKGLRLVQMWLPDTRTPEFAAEAHGQSLRANNSQFAAEDQAWVEAMADWKLN
jgi:hypothetical protein